MPELPLPHCTIGVAGHDGPCLVELEVDPAVVHRCCDHIVPITTFLTLENQPPDVVAVVAGTRNDVDVLEEPYHAARGL